MRQTAWPHSFGKFAITVLPLLPRQYRAFVGAGGDWLIYADGQTSQEAYRSALELIAQLSGSSVSELLQQSNAPLVEQQGTLKARRKWRHAQSDLQHEGSTGI